MEEKVNIKKELKITAVRLLVTIVDVTIVMLVWNSLIVDLLELKTLTFLDAYLIRLLFKAVFSFKRKDKILKELKLKK